MNLCLDLKRGLMFSYNVQLQKKKTIFSFNSNT